MDDSVLIAVSTIADGSISAGVSDIERQDNRANFLRSYGLTSQQAILVNLSYDSTDFLRFFTVSSEFAGDGMVTTSTITADALFTNERNVALFLPVADCIGAVLYDPVHHVIGLSHLGRHNVSQQGGSESIEYMKREFGTNPSNVNVWLSPSVGRETYPLHDYGNRSLTEVALEQLTSVGVSMDNILIDSRDTALDQKLFSHSEFLKGNRATDGRQAVLAMMRP